MAQKLAEGLIVLGASYEKDGCPIQALHCYHALVNQVLPPDVEVKARLNLARLMLQHTFNVKEACNHLLRAQSLSRSLIGCYCLKYEVADRLAAAQQLLGDEAGELATYAAASELWQAAQGSGEWAAVCVWACRLLQRQAAAHHRAGRPREAEAAAGEALAFAERPGGGGAAAAQRVAALLLLAQLALDRWDDGAADAAIKQLNAALGAAEGSGGTGGGGGGLGSTGFLMALLHYNVLQVLYMLRVGKVADVVKDKQQQEANQPPLSPEQADAPGVPPPPLIANLDSTWKQLAAAQSGSAASAAAAPYELPGMSLEPLVCLVAALALRQGGGRPRLTLEYLQRGLEAVEQLKRRAGLLAAADSGGGGGGGGGGGVDEVNLAPQQLAPAGSALRLQLMLLQCRAQVLLARGELAAARGEVLCVQALCERYPRLLGPQLPAAHLLTGQYCTATGEHAAAAAHFQAARQHAPNPASAAVASVLEAAAHLSLDDAAQAQARAHAAAAQHTGRGQEAASAGPGPSLARAIEALGPFYAGAVAAPGSAPARLGGLEDAAALLASAACLAQQGNLPAANALLSKALRTAHRKLGHMQVVCGVLNELALSFLGPQLVDCHSALEAARSATAFARAAGDMWAEARSKRAVAAALERQAAAAAAAGNANDAEASAAGAREAVEAAARRETKVAEAVAGAKADSGRHGYAAGWRLSAMVQD